MSDDLNSSVDELNKKLSITEKLTASIQGHLKGANNAAKGVSGNAGSNTQIANFSGPGGGGGGGPFGGGGGPFVAPQAQNNTSFTGYQGSKTMGALKAIGGVMATTVMNAAAFLPTTQEALTTQQIAERMRFYSNNMNSPAGNPRSAINNNPKYQYGIMNTAMQMGTSVSPGDILQAVNAGAGAGLTSGLKNYNAGSGFSGVLGGAALASNLSPGIGLTGGMGVMATLNQAQNVNMLKMLGIQVRGNDGRTMNDLPQIIDQLYGILTRNGPVSPEDIAVSLMSGNALDSILNQYIGQDSNTRSTIIAGLMQRLKSGNKLRTSGSKGALSRTGATTTGVASAASRNMAEQQLIESYSDVTNKAAVGTNNVLQGLYGLLADPKLKARGLLEGVQKVSVGLTSFAGARGGAGGSVISSLVDSGSDLLKAMYSGENKAGSAALQLGGLAGMLGIAAGAQTNTAKHLFNQERANNPDTMYNTAPGSTQSTMGPQFTGAITIHVSAPPGSDPYAFSSAFLDAMK
jgi:hypothetical protein